MSYRLLLLVVNNYLDITNDTIAKLGILVDGVCLDASIFGEALNECYGSYVTTRHSVNSLAIASGNGALS